MCHDFSRTSSRLILPEGANRSMSTRRMLANIDSWVGPACPCWLSCRTLMVYISENSYRFNDIDLGIFDYFLLFNHEYTRQDHNFYFVYREFKCDKIIKKNKL